MDGQDWEESMNWWYTPSDDDDEDDDQWTQSTNFQNIQTYENLDCFFRTSNVRKKFVIVFVMCYNKVIKRKGVQFMNTIGSWWDEERRRRIKARRRRRG